jgi:chorismate dehydratase
MLVIGQIDYANVYPIFHQLNKYSEYKFVKGVPSFLNTALREGVIDLSPCSSIEYAKSSDDYILIPGISISSTTEVKSVMLYSSVPIDELGNKKVYLTAESGTSVVLVKILFNEVYGFQPEFTDTLEGSDAKVLIGDKALFELYNGENNFVYDLCTLWNKFTGLPFVFALWTARKDAAELKRAEFEVFTSQLEIIKKDSKSNLAALLDHYSMKGLTSYQIIDYWETMDYNLSDKHVQGLLLFYRYAKKYGAIKEVPAINFFV